MSACPLVKVSAAALLISLLFTLGAAGEDRLDIPPGTAPPPAPIPPSRVEPPPVCDPAPPPAASPFALAPESSEAEHAAPFQAGPFGNGLGREFRPSVLRADYGVTWFPVEPVRGQNANLGFVREDFAATVPLWHTERNDIAATVHVRNELFQTDAVLPNTTRAFPDQLWDVRFGGSYRHLFDNGWIAGAGVGLGSSGDRPFEHSRDFTGSVNAFLTVPQGEHNYWLFNLAYSSNSDLPFPIPGLAFVWQPVDYFRAHIGLPFQLMYRPVDDLTLDLSYMLLYTVRARATYRVAPWLRLFAGYEVGDEAYPLADRPDANDRLFYYDQRVLGGAQFRLGHGMSLDFSGGYAFDRFYFEGQHLSDRNNNSLDVGNGPFLSLRLQTRW
jgi:hypothetical protein